jgi:CRISPR/Cas system-associated exonuclease Cas4 (RecB family)
VKISASSLKDFALCPRKWAFRKLAGIETEGGEGATLGTEVHSVCERYARREGFGGLSKHAIRIAMPAFKLIKPTAQTELAFEYDVGTVQYHGHIDYVEHRDGGNVLVRDYKSTKSFGFSLSQEELQTDEQSVLYSWALYEQGAASVSAQWVYLSTTKPGEPLLCEVDMSKEHVRVHLEVLQDRALEMLSIKEFYEKTLDINVAPGNTDACKQYRKRGQEFGCPHHPTNGGLCKPPSNDNQPLELISMSSLADRIKSKKLTPAMLGMLTAEPAKEPVLAIVPDVAPTTIEAEGFELVPVTFAASDEAPPTSRMTPAAKKPSTPPPLPKARFDHDAALDACAPKETMPSPAEMLAPIKEYVQEAHGLVTHPELDVFVTIKNGNGLKFQVHVPLDRLENVVDQLRSLARV